MAAMGALGRASSRVGHDRGAKTQRGERMNQPVVWSAIGWLTIGALVSAAGACGGKAIVDGTTGGTGGNGTGGSAGGSGAGATGGSGGDPVTGGCPASPSGVTPLVAVPTLLGTTTCVEAAEVTRGQYEIWLNTGGVPAGLPVACSFNVEYEPTADWPPGGVGLERPVAHVDWCDALAYCLDHDRRLCGRIGAGPLDPNDTNDATESEWFNACSNQGQRAFPYGQDYEPSTCNGSDLGVNTATDVASHVGCVDATGMIFDLSGNVWEYEDSCAGDAGDGDDCSIRGGAYNNGPNSLDCGANVTAQRGGTAVNIGFRCCADPLE